MEKLNVVLMTVILISSLSAYATTDQRSLDDKVQCVSTCVAVDFENSRIVNLGTVVGRSEIDQGEAFDVMTQACANVAAGRSDQLRVFLARTITSQATEATSSSYSEVPHGISFFDFDYELAPKYFSRSSSSSKGFTYTLMFPNLDDCKELKVNKNGKPKYIGSGQPLG